MENKLVLSTELKRLCEKQQNISKVARFLYLASEGNNFLNNRLNIQALNYLDIRKGDSLISYSRGKAPAITEGGKWARNGRSATRPAKALQSLFDRLKIRTMDTNGLNIYENFANLISGSMNPNNWTLNIAEGDQIAQIYDLPSPFSSCMKGEGSEGTLDIYCNNSERVKITYVTERATDESGWDFVRCIGRALLWTTDEGVRIMDRIYGSQDVATFMKITAFDKGMIDLCKLDQSAGCYHFMSEACETNSDIFQITLNTDHEYYPYIDTFYRGGHGYLTNDRNYREHQFTYQCTDRKRQGENRVQTTTGEWFDRDEIREVDGEYYHYSETSYVNSLGVYVLTNDDARCIIFSVVAGGDRLYFVEDYTIGKIEQVMWNRLQPTARVTKKIHCVNNDDVSLFEFVYKGEVYTADINSAGSYHKQLHEDDNGVLHVAE